MRLLYRVVYLLVWLYVVASHSEYTKNVTRSEWMKDALAAVGRKYYWITVHFIEAKVEKKPRNNKTVLFNFLTSVPVHSYKPSEEYMKDELN